MYLGEVRFYFDIRNNQKQYNSMETGKPYVSNGSREVVAGVGGLVWVGNGPTWRGDVPLVAVTINTDQNSPRKRFSFLGCCAWKMISFSSSLYSKN
jgi:hypothetical protein